MKRIAAALAAMAWVLGMAWLAGFDFNSRGYAALNIGIFASIAAAFAYGAVWTYEHSK